MTLRHYLSILFATLSLSGCMLGQQGQPLDSSERRFVNQIERHQRIIDRSDSRIQTKIIMAKRRSQDEALPLGAVRRYLNSRRALIQNWDGQACPSKRFERACRFWFDTLAAQVAWAAQLIDYINSVKPDSKQFGFLMRAAKQKNVLWDKAQSELSEIRQEAGNG